ncbi:unnamed protein product [Kuraishia capsulata CBS 1993]|uniref:Zn(2)-C6 fungal-type domain-containing protein n=1 Tax=Kuraishia capsulata CBS 1993 TaxID=1382522 RepID=W6MXD8_9ASCO|nr:uncharacterized protein KUCA_T00004699001 [Kuraishia capsulata CBS 1993]CDK28715.1 unnamed protein product [Kuraishia capsulata CBS 1993]
MTDLNSRKKTFSGCWTCRSRKVKCTMERPMCQRCVRAGVECTGYDIKLKWSIPIKFDTSGNSLPLEVSDNDYVRRRTVDFVKYTEDQTYETYDDIDKDLSDLQSFSPVPVDTTKLNGPFGVFRGCEGVDKNAKRHQTSSVSAHRSGLPDKAVSNVPTAEYQNVLSGPTASTPNSISQYSPSPSLGSSGYSMRPKAFKRNQSVYANPLDGFSGSADGNEWLSTELIGDALLTASALNGDMYFLDLFNGTGNDLGADHSEPQTMNLMPQSNARGLDPKSTVAQQHYMSAHVDPQQPEFIPDEVLQLLFHKKESVDKTADAQHTISQPNSRRATRTGEVFSIMLDADETTTMPSQIMTVSETEHIPPTLAIDKFGLPCNALTVKPMTRYLMNYYIDQVADMMTVIPLAKNPWKFIYFPRAIMAIGELGSLGRTSNAKNCLLNALLAVSAFNLQSKFTRNSDEMKHYLSLGIQLRQQATQYLKVCLDEDILTQKYKDVLVAVLSMVTIDVVWGTMSDCKVHLDICEKVIEKKMKVKKKLSSQATILHRIFSSLKMIQDSTSLENIQESEIFLNEQNYKEFIMDVNSPSDANIAKARSEPHQRRGSFDSVASTDSPAPRGVFHEKINDQGKIKIEFIVNNTENDSIELNPDAKDAEQGIPSFIDITRSSFQPSKNKVDDDVISSDAIYGLPNSLILLFSEVVYLYRFKTFHDQENRSLPPFFGKLAQDLERKILNWRLEWKLMSEDRTLTDSSSQSTADFLSPRYEGIYHHVMSFYHGLAVYFYRGVRNMNPLYLQERVEKVLNHLNEIQSIVEKNEGTFIIPLFWQGFVAGSEAMTVFLQKGFNLWGQNISKTGIGSYWVARQIMLEVWRRKNSNAKKHTWADVIHDWGTNVMLT